MHLKYKSNTCSVPYPGGNSISSDCQTKLVEKCVLFPMKNVRGNKLFLLLSTLSLNFGGQGGCLCQMSATDTSPLTPPAQFLTQQKETFE